MGRAGWTGHDCHYRAQVGLPLELAHLDDRARIASLLQEAGVSFWDACHFHACASLSVPLAQLLTHTSDFSASPFACLICEVRDPNKECPMAYAYSVLDICASCSSQEHPPSQSRPTSRASQNCLWSRQHTHPNRMPGARLC